MDSFIRIDDNNCQLLKPIFVLQVDNVNDFLEKEDKNPYGWQFFVQLFNENGKNINILKDKQIIQIKDINGNIICYKFKSGSRFFMFKKSKSKKSKSKKLKSKKSRLYSL